MTTTFRTDLPSEDNTRPEPCLCAQMCDAFSRMFRDREDTLKVRTALAKEADPKCPVCRGTGVEEQAYVPETHSFETARGSTMLTALGLPVSPAGTCSIADARRGLWRARNVDLSHLLEESEVVYGAPRTGSDGVVEMRPLRVFNQGLNADGLADRLARFETFLNGAVRAGATEIRWD